MRPKFLSHFDSASDFVNANNLFLHNKVFRGQKLPYSGIVYSNLINSLPVSFRKKLYGFGGKVEAFSYKKINSINADEISNWIYDIHPKKKFPAIAIGSSNGALNHLYALLGIPWLPQTFLIPVNTGKSLSVDHPRDTIEWSAKHAPAFLRNNTKWQLSQMMDPVQDRVRAGEIAYFRIKMISMNKWYLKFLKERLEPGGVIIIINSGIKWPVIKIDSGHTFQFGGLGTLPAEEFYNGSKRISRFLEKEKSSVKKWDIPQPDAESPEAEWGFETSLLKDISGFADEKGFKKYMISYNHPQETSEGIAEMYREFYRHKNQPDDRLFIESFNILSPLLTLKTGSVPYWLFFNTQSATEMLNRYLKNTGSYNEIFATILSNGKRSLGMAEISDFENILSHAEKKSGFIGMNKNKYPFDLGVYLRFAGDIKKIIRERYPVHQISFSGFHNNYSKYFTASFL